MIGQDDERSAFGTGRDGCVRVPEAEVYELLGQGFGLLTEEPFATEGFQTLRLPEAHMGRGQ